MVVVMIARSGGGGSGGPCGAEAVTEQHFGFKI